MAVPRCKQTDYDSQSGAGLTRFCSFHVRDLCVKVLKRNQKQEEGCCFYFTNTRTLSPKNGSKPWIFFNRRHLLVGARCLRININKNYYPTLSVVFSAYSLIHYLDELLLRGLERSSEPDSRIKQRWRSRVGGIRERNRGSHITPC